MSAWCRGSDTVSELLCTCIKSTKATIYAPPHTHIHYSGSVVRLSNYGHAEAVITGIDQYGYLLVRRREDRQELSLQPDGNSFDIMRGLIAMKTNS